MLNVLIIEDEAKAARELATLLKQADEDTQVVAILDSVEQALQWFSTQPQPDLILSDIQLGDGTCFEIFNRVAIQSPVIFCTAFDEFLLKAFDTNAISYLLKPITRQNLEKALEKFHGLKKALSKPANPDLSKLLDQVNQQYKTSLLVHHKEKIIPVPVKDIAYFYLDTTSLSFVTLTNQKFFITASLDEIEKSLNPVHFYRANRQFLINRNAILNAERFFARKLVTKLIVDTPETIVISKAKASDFLHWLES